MANKDRRGGKREGAGRPKRDTEYLHIRIPRQVAEIIKTSAQEENKTLGDWVVEKLGLHS